MNPLIGCLGSLFGFHAMPKQINIGFLISLLLLIISEYFFLQEIYLQKRALIILPSALGILIGGGLFVFYYKKYRKITR
jgi:hypothetical protein